MQKLYALIVLLMMALVACTPAAEQQSPSPEATGGDTSATGRPRFLISYTDW